jgi:hypothetical protein
MSRMGMDLLTEFLVCFLERDDAIERLTQHGERVAEMMQRRSSNRRGQGTSTHVRLFPRANFQSLCLCPGKHYVWGVRRLK